MSYLLDTNVLSEWTKPRPTPGVIEWLAQVAEDDVFLSVVTFAELRHGIERLPAGRRRRQLDEWRRGKLALRFEGRILLIDGAIADEWGRLVARQEARNSNKTRKIGNTRSVPLRHRRSTAAPSANRHLVYCAVRVIAGLPCRLRPSTLA